MANGNDEDEDVLGTATFSQGDFIKFEEPDGVYPVELLKLSTETKPNKFRNGELQTRLVWEFIPVGYDGPGSFKWWTSMSTHEKSKFPSTCVALGVPVPTPEQSSIKKSTFVGRRARALIMQVKGIKDPTQRFPRITQLLPMPLRAMSTGGTRDAIGELEMEIVDAVPADEDAPF